MSPDQLLTIIQAQRDVGLLVPINFHTVPSVSLRAACFSTNRYEDASFQKCFSNLLAVGLRRFVIDVYWDALRGEWSLCPAEVPTPGDLGGGSSTAPVPTTSLSTSVSSTSAGVERSASSIGFKRQEASSSSNTESTASTSSSASSSSTVSSEEISSSFSSSSLTASVTSSPTPSASPSPLAEPDQQLGSSVLYMLGDYNCTSTITLGYLTGIFNDFLEATATTTDASFTHLLLNIHAAASWKNPNEPAQQPATDRLPGAVGNLLSEVIKGNLSDEIYTPTKLADQRANLKRSWNDVDDDNNVRPGYYSVQVSSDGMESTTSGWPTEAYIQFREFYRLIALIGTVDPQMSAYDLTPDLPTIFPPSTLSPQQNLTFSSNGTLTHGCLSAPSTPSLTPETNSSFAFAPVPSSISLPPSPNLFAPIPAVGNLTTCGISPLLNHTLASSTADRNPLPYAAFAHASLWSWAPGEPLNATDPSAPGATGNRCAAAYVDGAFAGRWHVVDCGAKMRVACQVGGSPYAWVISRREARYALGDEACGEEGGTFSVPHVAMENAYLTASAKEAFSRDLASSTRRGAQKRDGADDGGASASVLLNLNSMDVADCWVAEVNGTCPYQPPSDLTQTRIVVVPTVAAVIIFVCAALTFFVKCAANRREGKRGARRMRRMREGWEYEGVPS